MILVKMSSSKYRHARNKLHISFLFFFFLSPPPPPPFFFQNNLEEGDDALHQLGLNLIYKYTCQRDICFLLSKVNNQSHLISNLSHMLCRHHHKYNRI